MEAIKSILVHMDSLPRSRVRLQLAHDLAEQHGAEVTALYAAMSGDLMYPLGASVGYPWEPIVSEFNDERRTLARACYDGAVASGLRRLQWAELTQRESTYGFGQRALYSDLVVMGQYEPGASTAQDVMPDFVESVLIESGRPVLIVPYACEAPSLPATVLVAWKPTREAARAVSDALPLLRSARQVHVATWSDDPFSPTAPQDIEAQLRRHGVDPTMHGGGKAPEEMGESLLSLATDVGADLLVMGCYGHSRTREWVLGGATRTALQSMTIPVLMTH